MIPEDELNQIKRDNPIERIVRSRGIELRKHGKDLIGTCPFHQDNDPSFVVTPDKGLFHCLGCGKAGNVIQFVMAFDGVSFRHAVEILREGGSALYNTPSDGPLKQNTVPRLKNPLSMDDADAGPLLDQLADFYHERLEHNPDAIDYLKKRGIYSPEAIARFSIGFCDRTLGLRLPDTHRKEGQALRDVLKQSGALRPNGREHFRGTVTFPIRDAQGHVVEIYGRRIAAHMLKTTPRHLYLPGPHAGIWNPEALDHETLILCEAAIDALTFWVNGLRNVTFIYGTQGFSDELFAALLKSRVRKVKLAYDADEAGHKAAQRDVERLSAQGLQVFRIRFPHGMDANEYANKVQPAAQSLQPLVNSAEWQAGSVDAGVAELRSAPAAKDPTPQPVPSLPAPASSSNLAASPLAASPTPENQPDPPKLEEATKEKRDVPMIEPPPNPTPSPSTIPALTNTGTHLLCTLGSREYRIGGLEKNHGIDSLKITLRLKVNDDFHQDALDLAQDTPRRRFIERAYEETGLERNLLKRDLGKLLLALETRQQERLDAELNPATNTHPAASAMSQPKRREALDFLKAPDLIERIREMFAQCGLVGEADNLLAGYLACTSRKLAKPLAVIIQSTSAAGKSTLMEAILAMFPAEERIKYSAMTGQSLYYLGETDLQHKILAIVEEEGAEKASYALKLLQSEGELTIASTGKNPTTGRMETQEYRLQGPVMIFLTTTAVEIDEELLNRCLVLTVDESRLQTERIHAIQRQARTREGMRQRKQKKQVLQLMTNVQRLIDPIEVLNPYADQLTFTSRSTRTRRDHEKYLTLIDAIALLHQHQRPREADETCGVCSEYIQVTLDDIALANRLAPELLGRSLDELPPQTRRALETIKELVREKCEQEDMEQHFALLTRREIRERLGWSVTQVRVHLARLCEYEYIMARAGRMGSKFSYELLVDCRSQDKQVTIGLIDDALMREREKSTSTTNNLAGSEANLAGQNPNLTGGGTNGMPGLTA